MVGINRRSMKSETEGSPGCTPAFCVLGPLLAPASRSGAQLEWEGDCSLWPRGGKGLCPAAAPRQAPSSLVSRPVVKGRSLTALMWLHSCQCSGEAKTTTMMTLHLRTTRSRLPRPSSLWRKPRSASTSALACWCPSTGRNSYRRPSANLLLPCFPQDCFCPLRKIAGGTGTPVHCQA